MYLKNTGTIVALGVGSPKTFHFGSASTEYRNFKITARTLTLNQNALRLSYVALQRTEVSFPV
jgi:hypothetical protein